MDLSVELADEFEFGLGTSVCLFVMSISVGHSISQPLPEQWRGLVSVPGSYHKLPAILRASAPWGAAFASEPHIDAGPRNLREEIGRPRTR